MKHRFHLSVSLLLCLLQSLSSFAYATIPDLSWIPGIYDSADLDAAIELVTSSTAVIDPLPPDGDPFTRVVSIVRRTVEDPVATAIPSAIHARAPPVRLPGSIFA
jgi:hypothetical protein